MRSPSAVAGNNRPASSKEQMIVIFMAQLHPSGDLSLDRQVNALAYQAIID
jgi:hypothetical protein